MIINLNLYLIKLYYIILYYYVIDSETILQIKSNKIK